MSDEEKKLSKMLTTADKYLNNNRLVVVLDQLEFIGKLASGIETEVEDEAAAETGRIRTSVSTSGSFRRFVRRCKWPSHHSNFVFGVQKEVAEKEEQEMQK
jgi:hypothetical protein